MKERKTFIESAILHLSSSGSDVASTPHYYLISLLVDFPKHTATVSQKIKIVILCGCSEPEKIEKVETKRSISTLESRNIEDTKIRCARKFLKACDLNSTGVCMNIYLADPVMNWWPIWGN